MAPGIIDRLIALLACVGLMLIVVAAVVGILKDPWAWLGMGMVASGFYLGKKRGW